MIKYISSKAKKLSCKNRQLGLINYTLKLKTDDKKKTRFE